MKATFAFCNGMDCIVRQIYPEERQRAGTADRRLSEFLARPNIVLLGDPGAGKSHTFRELAAACDGRYLTARKFLTLPVRNKGEVLFIDGLDERRGGRGDRDTVDALAAKLIEADPAAVRISCRVADWLGKSDLVSLEPFFEGHGGMVVLAASIPMRTNSVHSQGVKRIAPSEIGRCALGLRGLSGVGRVAS